MEDEVFLYCEENESAVYSDLFQRFGPPEGVAADFLNNLDGHAVARSQLNRNKMLLITLVTLIIMALVIGIHKLYIQHTILDIEYIESITYEDDPPLSITGPTFFHEEGPLK